MDSKEYKKITSGRNVLGYNTLGHTMQFLHDQQHLIDLILEAMKKGKIEKPSNHNGRDDQSTNFYLITMPNDELMEIFDALTQQITLDDEGNIAKSSAAVNSIAGLWWQLIDFDEGAVED
jgi:hypothetical protein